MVHGVAFWEVAPYQGLGSRVGQGLPILAVAGHAIPRRIHHHGGPAKGHLLRLSRIDSTCGQVRRDREGKVEVR